MALSGHGNGTKMAGGGTALRRIIVLVPNGPDVIQFILTAPADSLAKPKAAFEQVLGSIVFTGQAQPKKQRTDPARVKARPDDVPPLKGGRSAVASGTPVD